MVPLIMVQDGEKAVVIRFEGDGAEFKRIRSFGLDINTEITVVTSQAAAGGRPPGARGAPPGRPCCASELVGTVPEFFVFAPPKSVPAGAFGSILKLWQLRHS